MQDTFDAQLEEVVLTNTDIATNNINGEASHSGDMVSSDNEIRDVVQILQAPAQNNDKSSKNKWKNSTCSHIFILAIFTAINFNIGATVAIQANLYPAEAASKGVSSTRHAFIYGMNELVTFIALPLYSKYIMTVSSKFLLNTSILLISSSCILFGLVGATASGKITFSIVSFIIRAVQAFGETAYMLAMFSILAKKFPSRIGLIILSIGQATIFGIGIFLGKFVGIKLVQIGGYMMPFAILGCVLNFSVCITLWVLSSNKTESKQHHMFTKMLSMLNLTPVFIAILTIFGAACCFGFTFATMGFHLHQFHLKRMHLWLIYCLNIVVIIIINPLWGLLCIKWKQTRIPSILAATFIIVAFAIHGPAPFLTFDTTLWLCITGVVLQGIGIGGEVVCSCIGSNMELRMTVGSSVGTLMLVTVGYRNATMFIVVEHCVLAILNLSYVMYEKFEKPRTISRPAVESIRLQNEEEPLIIREFDEE